LPAFEQRAQQSFVISSLALCWFGVGRLRARRDRSKVPRGTQPEFGSGVTAFLATPHSFPTDWISVEPAERRATVTSLPDATAIPFPIRLQLVVEFYSQRT
jgi:ribosomal protein S4